MVGGIGRRDGPEWTGEVSCGLLGWWLASPRGWRFGWRAPAPALVLEERDCLIWKRSNLAPLHAACCRLLLVAAVYGASPHGVHLPACLWLLYEGWSLFSGEVMQRYTRQRRGSSCLQTEPNERTHLIQPSDDPPPYAALS